MQIAQKLYQGIEIDGETIGLITYMRTDGTNLSTDAIDTFRKYIKMNLVKNMFQIMQQVTLEKKLKMLKKHMKQLDQQILCVHQIQLKNI